MSRYVFRRGFQFSVGGGHATCLATSPRSGEVQAELWTLTRSGPRCQFSAPVGDGAGPPYALPVAAGRLLLCSWQDQRQRLSLLGPSGVLATGSGTGQWITAAPVGHGLALAVATGPDGRTEISRVEQDAGAGALRLTPVAQVATALRPPAVVAGARVVFASRAAAAPPQVLDLETGRVAPLPLPPPVRSAVPGCAAGDALLLGVVVGDRHQVAITTVDQPGEYEVWDGLEAIEGLVRPMALDPTGTELVLRHRTGICARLLRHRRRPAWTEEIAAPPGTPGAVAGWPAAGLWLPYATTTAPSELWWLSPGRRELRGPAGGPAAAGPTARTESFLGPAGPVEAVVYGDWRHAERVVVALHGGPAEHWPLAFDPGLHELAAAGLAVVAPNPRGSTGYGRAHQEAIKGAWGGPDLDDILAVGSQLARLRGRRRPPALYGTSYGAFLALLALAAADHWYGCVAVAPFLSGARLYAEATAPVRALLDRLQGATVVTDAIGPRDLLRQVPRMRGPVLVIHGEQDERIPVAHSRALVAALARHPAVDVTYRELAGRGHVAVRPAVDIAEFTEVIRFLGGRWGRAAPPPGAGARLARRESRSGSAGRQFRQLRVQRRRPAGPGVGPTADGLEQ